MERRPNDWRHVLKPDADQMVGISEQQKPVLNIVVDTEEEFDWNIFNSQFQSVSNLQEQHLTHRIFERFGASPTYVIDYPVVSNPEARAPLLDMLKDGKCQIGGHLHPWVTPPVREDVNERNSFPHNLPVDLQRDKLRQLGEAIGEHFGAKPDIFKSGRYGIDDPLVELLLEEGYTIDMSVLPNSDLSWCYGPDFTKCPQDPYWIGKGREILEIPLTVGLVGSMHSLAPSLYFRADSPVGRRLRLPGILARLRVLERIPLTPEGITLDEAKKVTRELLRRNTRVFTLSYHSSSLLPGSTPYVATQQELGHFLDWIEGFLDFFMGEIGGRVATPYEIRDLALQASSASGDAGAVATP